MREVERRGREKGEQNPSLSVLCMISRDEDLGVRKVAEKRTFSFFSFLIIFK
jgi:hypothetical protein